MYTIKKISEHAGVDKQKAYRFISKYFIKQSKRDDNNKIVFDDEIAKKIINDLKAERIESKAATNDDSQISLFLKNELDAKNEQISNLMMMLNRERMLNHQLTAKIETAESKKEEYQKTIFGLYKKIQ